MSTPYAAPERIRLPWRNRVVPLLAVAVAAPLTRLPPAVLRAVLAFVSRGARPARADQASAARRAVMAVSIRCAVNGCLQRAIATALLCRVRGSWPTWQLGVRTAPFGAHAWVEAEGRMIDEPLPEGYYTPLMTVAPARSGATPDRPAPLDTGTGIFRTRAPRGTGTGTFRMHRDVLSAETNAGAVLLNLRTGQYWQLNDTGLDSLRRMLSGQSVDDIALGLAGEYDIEPARSRHDLTTMADQLLGAGFLVKP
ncbi:lasso peptide biosynthesis PqqD family chaperone [Nocardia sp. NPDC051570]|uniref:lasso peptide biosynthesis PqqD family chaperone n=1 Tax=Nocardia sp. NPDC051570 TaxID=3364324 RepID=UPI003795D489